MAKRTKFKNDNTNTINNDMSNESGDGSNTLDVLTNKDINTVTSDVSHVKPDSSILYEKTDEEFEQGKILELNLIHKDDYVKFIELAIKYNLFNKVEDIVRLHKNDLCALIGFVINALYAKEIELEQHKAELMRLKAEQVNIRETSFDKPMNYSDLFGNLNTYKSWN